MNARLSDVFDGYLDLRYRLDPVAATRAGRHELDGLYAAYDPAAVRTHVAALRSYTGALEEVATDTLDDEIDRTAALHNARRLLLVYERGRPFARDPAFHLGHALDGLYALLEDGAADPARRGAALAERLSALPAFLSTAAAALTQPVGPLISAAAGMLPGGLELLDDAMDEGLAPVIPGADERTALRGAAREALIGFSDALAVMTERARDNVAIGREAFERLLHTAHMIPDGAAQLLRWAESAYSEARAGMVGAAAMAEPGTDWRELVRRLDAEAARVPGAALIRAYGEAIAVAERFAVGHGIVARGQPPVRVVPTPDFRRPFVPWVAYDRAGQFDTRQPGTLYVTMPDGVPTAAAGRHAGLASAVVHEIVPGHHHQGTIANGLPQVMRRVVESAAAREGWACYGETLMAEEGFYATPAARLLHAREVLRHAVRVIVDVSLHTNAITPEAAARRLRDEVGVDEGAARAEVARASAQPTWLSCFAVGRREIVRLRDDARRVWGSGFSPARFHDELLRYGAYPTALARWGMGLA